LNCIVVNKLITNLVKVHKIKCLEKNSVLLSELNCSHGNSK